MIDSTTISPSPRAEFLGGVRAELPLLLGVVPFGMIFGVLGLAAGMPGWAVVLSSSLIFGGSSQVVFAQLWGAATPPAVMVATIGVVNWRHLPDDPRLTNLLRYVPPAILGALIAPEIFAVGGAADFSPGNPRLWAALIALLTAWQTRNVLATIAIGMLALWALQAVRF